MVDNAKEENGIVFIPAYCFRCGEQICMIAAPLDWDGSKIVLQTAHNCKPERVTWLDEQLKKGN
ncbi:MAG TPA: hypothetical protein VIY48_07000 [Candidatus Paceibacterota bacterium]